MIPILLQPFLRRYYSPEAFGSMAVYISIIGILIVVTSFKYELAIILPKKDKEAANVLFLSVFLSLVFNLILALLIFFWETEIVRFFNITEKYHNYIYVVPLGTFLFSFYQSISQWLIRREKFFQISQNKFTRRGVEGTIQVFSHSFSQTYGLIIGDIAGHLANIISGIYFSLKSGFKLSLLSLEKIKYVLIKYIEYPKYNVIPSLLSACSYLLPTLIINKYYALDYTGYFDLSKQMLSIPLALVATSVSSVLLQNISVKYRNNERFLKEIKPIIVIIVIISIIEILVVYFWGEWLFSYVFGERWKFSGQISRLLVWSYAFNFFVATFTSIFLAMKKIKLLSIWQIFYFGSILILFFFKNTTFVGFLNIYVFIEVTCYIVFTILLFIIIKRFESQVRAN